MERLHLKAQTRKETGKGTSRRIRAQGDIPGVFYGTGLDPLPLVVNLKELDDAVLEARSLNALFDLTIDDQSPVPVMLRDYQVDNIDRYFTHVDFQKIDLSKKIKIEVSVKLVGKASGVKEGGILEHIRRALEVICLPTAIPESIDVDVSNLDIGDTIHVQDLTLPEGVELGSISNVTIAAVVAPVEEKVEEVAVEGEVPAEPEVIGEKKAEEGEAPAEEKKE